VQISTGKYVLIITEERESPETKLRSVGENGMGKYWASETKIAKEMIKMEH
jgi:hypothetical protein